LLHSHFRWHSMSVSLFGPFTPSTASSSFPKLWTHSSQSEFSKFLKDPPNNFLNFSWLNHIMHTNIMVFIVLELFTSFRLYPSRKWGLAGLSLFMASYLAWLHVIKYKADVWVYPVLEVLNLPQRIAFFALSLIFSVGLYIFGEFFNDSIWVREIKHAQKTDSAKKSE
jgi:hypothetical protein